jgi:hypothetical protein
VGTHSAKQHWVQQPPEWSYHPKLRVRVRRGQPSDVAGQFHDPGTSRTDAVIGTSPANGTDWPALTDNPLNLDILGTEFPNVDQSRASAADQ